jgi:hypothetical protein
MKFYSVDEIRAIVSSRAPTDDTIAVEVEAETETECIKLKLLFEFWPQYRTYIALPIVYEDDGFKLVEVRTSDHWYRYMKHDLRTTFGVRHLHNVNKKDNRKRVEQLLGLQYV